MTMPATAESDLTSHASNEPGSGDTSRIEFLDGLRCVAILGVLLFHYFSRWTPPWYPENLYPYHNVVLARFLSRGGYGVNLFFIVSGFVITLTLFKCGNFFEFFTRRFCRLFPAMLLCSVVTFSITTFVPGSLFNVHPASFLPSLTFIEPEIYNKLFSTTIFSNIDGAYWSLYVEVRFYLLISAIYFLNRKNFLRNTLWFSAITFLTTIGLGVLHLTGLRKMLEFAAISEFLPWFIIGIGYYLRFVRRPASEWLPAVALGTVQLLVIAKGEAVPSILAILIPAFFYFAMTNRMTRKVLSYGPLPAIGVSSYSLYLLHQNIGVTAIRFFAREFSLGTVPSIALACVVAIALIALSYGLFQWYEKPANKYLLGLFLNSKRGNRAPLHVPSLSDTVQAETGSR
jgi:peptidoglycan/LPS O-acetylase OafA/YrhL